MRRFHFHVAVDDLAASIKFYSLLFGVGPSVGKSDCAKWMLEDPRINLAILQRGVKRGLDHLGFQVDSDEELTKLRAEVLDYRSAANRAGAFHSPNEVPMFGVDTSKAGNACCSPRSPVGISLREAHTKACC